MLMIAGKFFTMAVLVAVGLLTVLYFRQDRMIFPARAYGPDYEKMVPERATKLEFTTSCGKQTAWYVPPRSGAAEKDGAPPRLWIFFGGNGSVALSWKGIVQRNPDADAGQFLVDYPGYGFCEGKPSPDTIAHAADEAVKALAQHLQVTPEVLLNRPVRVMGHSLGSGVALAFTVRHPVDRAVLVAPFTSFRAMADLKVTPAFGWMMKYRMDNVEAVRQLAARENPPQVIVTHGDADYIVPVEMGRELEKTAPDVVDYIEVPGADHGDILDGVEAYMAAELPRPVKTLEQAQAAARGELPVASDSPLTSATVTTTP